MVEELTCVDCSKNRYPVDSAIYLFYDLLKNNFITIRNNKTLKKTTT